MLGFLRIDFVTKAKLLPAADKGRRTTSPLRTVADWEVLGVVQCRSHCVCMWFFAGGHDGNLVHLAAIAAKNAILSSWQAR